MSSDLRAVTDGDAGGVVERISLFSTIQRSPFGAEMAPVLPGLAYFSMVRLEMVTPVTGGAMRDERVRGDAGLDRMAGRIVAEIDRSPA